MPQLKWSYRPYVQFRDRTDTRPVICALRPSEGGFSVEYISDHESGCRLFRRRRFSDEWKAIPVSGGKARITGLDDLSDYEFYIEDPDGNRSLTRLVRTGKPVSSVINYIHPDDPSFDFSGRYCCSPSILRLPSGRLLASHDVYRAKSPQCLTVLFKSDDNGATWDYLCDLFPCFWGKLFLLGGKLCMLSTSTEYGDLLIGTSDDEGLTWNTPTVIERGPGCLKAGFHRAPCVCAVTNGRIWFAVENGSWQDGGFCDCLLSAPVDADPLDPASWTLSEPLRYSDSWAGPGRACSIEGNPFVGTDGELYALYRFREGTGLLMRADVSRPERSLQFVRTVDLPFAHSKFEIVRGEDGLFYAAGNELGSDGKSARNVLSLYRSPDGVSYRRIMRIIDRESSDRRLTGFQYPSFIIEGKTVLLLSRTADNGAASFHDSNMITFHRFNIPEDFDNE